MQHREQKTNHSDSTKERAQNSDIPVLSTEDDILNNFFAEANKQRNKTETPIEVRTMRFILQYYPNWRIANRELNELAQYIQTHREIKELRGTIPWSVFEILMPKVIRRLIIWAYWEMIEAKHNAGVDPCESLGYTTKKLKPQSYIT